MSERTEPIWANDLFDFAQILQVGYLWPKNVSSKGISFAAFGVRHSSMLLQNGLKITPYLALKMSVTKALSNGIETKCHHSIIYSPYYSPENRSHYFTISDFWDYHPVRRCTLYGYAIDGKHQIWKTTFSVIEFPFINGTEHFEDLVISCHLSYT